MQVVEFIIGHFIDVFCHSPPPSGPQQGHSAVDSRGPTPRFLSSVILCLDLINLLAMPLPSID